MAKCKPVFYAVARGKSPGIYTSWADCSAQVTGFPGAIFKGHQTFSEATTWMCAHGAARHAELVDTPPSALRGVGPSHRALRTYGPGTGAPPRQPIADTAPPPSQSFRASWKPFAKLEEDVKLKLEEAKPFLCLREIMREYNIDRTWAMVAEIERRFFDGTTTLAGYQALCHAIRIEHSDSIEQCRADIRGTLVNIVDLIEALENKTPVRVWRPDEWASFCMYTLKAEHRFALGVARKSEILECFLQDLHAAGPHKSGNPRPLRSGGDLGLLTTAPTSPAPTESGAWAKSDTEAPGRIKHEADGAVVHVKREAERPARIKQEDAWPRAATPRHSASRTTETETKIKPETKFEDAWPSASAFIAARFGTPTKAAHPVPTIPTTQATNPKKRRAQDLDAVVVSAEAPATKRPKFAPTVEIPDSDASDGAETDWGWDSELEEDGGDIFEDAMAAAAASQQTGRRDAPIVIEDDSPPVVTARRVPLGARSQGEAVRDVETEVVLSAKAGLGLFGPGNEAEGRRSLAAAEAARLAQDAAKSAQQQQLLLHRKEPCRRRVGRW